MNGRTPKCLKDKYDMSDRAGEAVILHGYFRSTASWRVRIALALKRIPVRHVTHRLRYEEQHAASYLAINPQGLVPALQICNGTVITQSLAIIEWLDETFPSPPLLPGDVVQRAKIRAFAQVIASDSHPLQNIKVLNKLRRLGQNEDEVLGWARSTIAEGLTACEQLASFQQGAFVFGNAPTLADTVLVPHMRNARRYGCVLSAWPRLLEIEAACMELGAFRQAVPELQSDAEQ